VNPGILPTVALLALLALLTPLTQPLALGAQAADSAAVARADTAVRAIVGAFVDGYFAYDFNRPGTLDRQFTTQPARHGEFNVNLAYLEVKAEGPRLRGRVAAQFGTSVQSNYAGEPTRGAISGPAVSRFIQEAVAGYQVARKLWIDGGVFFSNMGMESWISRDNPTYTRSLVADYSPYYSAGVKLTYQASTQLSVRVDLVNGWQNVSETNTDKGVGARVDYAVAPGSTVSYYNFVGNEIGGLLRTFNGVGATVAVTPAVRLLAQVDVGSQQRGAGGGGGSAVWYGCTAVARARVTPAVALSARAERYDDPDNVIVGTDGRGGFRVTGGSLGVDVQPVSRVLWRTELRGLAGSNAVFVDPRASGGYSDRNGVVVTSLALTF